MKPSLTKQILFDFFDGKYTSIQRKMIEEWLLNQENRELFYKYLDEWEAQNPQYVVKTEIGFEKVMHSISNETEKEATIIREIKPVSRNGFFSWLIAASISVVCLWFGWNYYAKPKPISYEKLTKNIRKSTSDFYETTNNTTKPMVVNLPDMSSVILQPKGRISYSAAQYGHTKREVILSGQAFFEVHKNPDVPFFVYANNLITKVVGTSFLVDAQPSATATEIVVKTGRVAVFLQSDQDKEEKLKTTSLEGIVLKANEKIKVNRNDNSISKPALAGAEKMMLAIQKLTFDFDDTPASDVLDALRRAYNVQIVYDKNELSNCRLTAHLSDEPLIEKIKLICIALDATYEDVNSKIIIHSNGCN